MAFNLTFDARQVAPNVGLDPVPSGVYDVMITSTEEKLVKDGNGKAFIEIGMEIISGEFKGRKVFDRLNHKNPNQQTRDIAFGTLSAICYVTGIMVIQQSTAELHGKPFRVNVVKVPRDDDPTRSSNEVRGYLDSMGYKPGENPGVAGAATGGAAAGGWNAGAETTQQTQAQTWTPEPNKTIEHVPATTQAAATTAAPADATVALDPRLIPLLTAGIPLEAAKQALAAQDAATAAAATAAAATPAPQTTQAAAGPTPQEIAARAAALVSASMGNGATTQAQVETPPGLEAVPDWAKPQT